MGKMAGIFCTAILFCRFAAAQNVGIGVTLPTARLYVAGTGEADGTLAIAGTNNVSHFYYGVNEDTYIRGGKSNSLLVLNDAGGNVGVGAATGINSKLTVRTGPTVTGIEHTNGTVRLATYAGYGAAQNAYLGTVSNHPLYIMTNGVGNTVFYNGMLAVSTTSYPTRPLHVFQNFGMALGITNFEGTNTWDFTHGTVFSTIPALLYTFNGTIKSGMRSDDGSYFTVSDLRAKTAVQPMNGVLERLMQLQPYTYFMKNAAQPAMRTGFISQEVAPLFPDLVALLESPADSAGKHPQPLLAVNYAGFSVVAIKAIQEQQLEIAALKAEVERLRALEKRVQALERR